MSDEVQPISSPMIYVRCPDLSSSQSKRSFAEELAKVGGGGVVAVGGIPIILSEFRSVLIDFSGNRSGIDEEVVHAIFALSEKLHAERRGEILLRGVYPKDFDLFLDAGLETKMVEDSIVLSLGAYIALGELLMKKKDPGDPKKRRPKK